MTWLTCGVVFTLFSIGNSDYLCVCNYNAEKTVFSTPSPQSNVLGYMYEFDCKPQTEQSGGDTWIAVAYEHKLGYVEKDSNLQIQTCPGAIPDEDKLPQTSLATSSQETNFSPTKEIQTTTLQTTPASAVITTISAPGPVTSVKPSTMSSSKSSAVTTQVISAIKTTQRSIVTTSSSTPGPMTSSQPTTGPITSNQPSYISSSKSSAVRTVASTTGPVISNQSTTVSSYESTFVATTRGFSQTVTAQRPTTPSQHGFSIKRTSSTSTSKATTTQNSITTTATPKDYSTYSTTQSTTIERTTTPHIRTLQGHLELCPNRIQHLAKQPGELLAQFGKSCYEVVQASVSWTHAESNCRQNGGHLIHIANQQEQDFIYSFLVEQHSQTVWLGLHDRSQEENFEWTSGDPVTYTNWKAGRKNYRYHDSEDCVYMTPTNGQWDDIQCGGNNAIAEVLQGHRHAYVCQYATVHPAHSDGNLNLCSYSLHQLATRDRGVLGQYGQSCYEIIPNVRLAWQHAEDVCHSRGGHLVYISNAQEQQFLQGFLGTYSKNHAVWIGLTDHNTEGRFHWSSGSPVQFTNWAPGHISNYASHYQEDCVVFMPYKNGQWDDVPCGHTSHSIFGGTSSSGETHTLICQYRTAAQPAIVG